MYSQALVPYQRGGLSRYQQPIQGEFVETSKSSKFDDFMDGVQNIVSVAGMLPGVGVVPDLVNAGVYAARGKGAEAAMSAASAIPIAGDAIGGARIAAKGLDGINTVSKVKPGRTMLQVSEKPKSFGSRVSGAAKWLGKGALGMGKDALMFSAISYLPMMLMGGGGEGGGSSSRSIDIPPYYIDPLSRQMMMEDRAINRLNQLR